MSSRDDAIARAEAALAVQVHDAMVAAREQMAEQIVAWIEEAWERECEGFRNNDKCAQCRTYAECVEIVKYAGGLPGGRL